MVNETEIKDEDEDEKILFEGEFITIWGKPSSRLFFLNTPFIRLALSEEQWKLLFTDFQQVVRANFSNKSLKEGKEFHGIYIDIINCECGCGLRHLVLKNPFLHMIFDDKLMKLVFEDLNKMFYGDKNDKGKKEKTKSRKS